VFSRLATVAAFTPLFLAETGAFAGGLVPAEADRLVRGDTVIRPQEVARAGRRYVGGVTYTIVDAEPGDIAALLEDVSGWRRFLPKTHETRRVGNVEGDALIEVTHGSTLMQVGYTVRVRREGNVVRFWMDASRPHDIEDAWGFFRSEALAGHRTLVTYGILIDMGAGLLRDLFEDRVRALALEVPDRVRGLLLERPARDLRSSSAAGVHTRY
jgi:hypothetical protein